MERIKNAQKFLKDEVDLPQVDELNVHEYEMKLDDMSILIQRLLVRADGVRESIKDKKEYKKVFRRTT